MENKKSKRIKFSLKYQVSLLITLTIVIGIIISIGTIYIWTIKLFREEIKNDLKLIGINTSLVIDSKNLKNINSILDEDKEEYVDIQNNLQKVKLLNKEQIKYIYILHKDGKDIKYTVDAEPTSSSDHSFFGERFNVEDFSYVNEAFNGKFSVEDSPTLDIDFGGYVQTGYVPLFDEKNDVISVLAVDMDVSTIKKRENTIINFCVISFSISFIVAIIAGILFGRRITKPFILLTKSSQKLADGEFDIIINIKRNDEIGVLVENFNVMAKKLGEKSNLLKKQNQALEEIVYERTQDLTQINKEFRDIFNNMTEAVFSIDGDFKITNQYSRYASEIFGNINLSGENFINLIFKEENDESENFKLNLKSLFNIETIHERIEYEYEIIDKNNVIKYIKIEVKPIYETEKKQISRLMVIINDISDKRRIELDKIKIEESYKENLDQIINIINSDNELFRDFIYESQELIEGFVEELPNIEKCSKNEEYYKDLLRKMHIIKGNAKAFGLLKISNQAQVIEELLTNIKNHEIPSFFIDEINEEVEKINVFYSEINDIYNKINKNKNVEKTSETIADDIIRVKVDDLNNLEMLLKEADSIVDKRKNEIGFHEEGLIELKTVIQKSENKLVSIKQINIDRLFARLPNIVSELSVELNKKVKLVIESDNFEVDKNIFEKISEIIIHLVRNAIDHGIEFEERRLLQGKDECGSIVISTKMLNKTIEINVIDDGSGIDIDKIKSKAVKKGFISLREANSIDYNDLINLIFSSGFSTKEIITSTSGVGVGLDIVKTIVEETLEGKIEIKTVKGIGTNFKLIIPIEKLSSNYLAII